MAKFTPMNSFVKNNNKLQQFKGGASKSLCINYSLFFWEVVGYFD
jgi:hypothetical protein